MVPGLAEPLRRAGDDLRKLFAEQHENDGRLQQIEPCPTPALATNRVTASAWPVCST